MASTIVRREKTKKKCGLERLPRIATITKTQRVVEMTTLCFRDNIVKFRAGHLSKNNSNKAVSN